MLVGLAAACWCFPGSLRCNIGSLSSKLFFTESDYCSKITSVTLVCDYGLSIIIMNRKLDSQKLRSGLSEYFLLAADL